MRLTKSGVFLFRYGYTLRLHSPSTGSGSFRSGQVAVQIYGWVARANGKWPKANLPLPIYHLLTPSTDALRWRHNQCLSKTMENNQLQRLIRLAQRTGDTLIVAGEGEPVVIMPVDQYECLLGAEEDFEWTGNDYDEIEEIPFNGSAMPAMEWEGGFDEEDDDPIQSIDELNAMTTTAMEEFEAEKAVEEGIEPKDSDFEPGEERFYLEPIE
ncbi:MAG: hypothetical protein Q8P30_04220 [Candidatus Uhrbacteria bacterium]|nr:hypothetical protein [Candidatus Uhrbacteria bacterium]